MWLNTNISETYIDLLQDIIRNQGFNGTFPMQEMFFISRHHPVTLKWYLDYTHNYKASKKSALEEQINAQVFSQFARDFHTLLLPLYKNKIGRVKGSD